MTKIKKSVYEAELLRLQGELVHLQEWVKRGRAAQSSSSSRDATPPARAARSPGSPQYLNPRNVRVVALPAPSERQRTQWYFQRYVEQLPAAGEIVLFDRSWYNRAVVEPVMGYCTPAEHRLFLRQCPTFERMLVDAGILLRKYWFSVSDEEQERRFASARQGPAAPLEASPSDLRTREKWVEFSPRQGRDVRPHRPRRVAVVRRRGRHQAARAAEHDRPPARPRSRTSGRTGRRSSCRRGHRKPTTTVHRASSSAPCPTTPPPWPVRDVP